jgi:hypothetical protein
MSSINLWIEAQATAWFTTAPSGLWLVCAGVAAALGILAVLLARRGEWSVRMFVMAGVLAYAAYTLRVGDAAGYVRFARAIWWVGLLASLAIVVGALAWPAADQLRRRRMPASR